MATQYSFTPTSKSAVNFGVRINGLGHSRSAEVSIMAIPDGDPVIDFGGINETRLPYKIRLASISDYNTLAGYLRLSGTLNCPDGASLTAGLVSISRDPEYLQDGSVHADANFIAL
jgi:hypothetical protein